MEQVDQTQVPNYNKMHNTPSGDYNYPSNNNAHPFEAQPQPQPQTHQYYQQQPLQQQQQPPPQQQQQQQQQQQFQQSQPQQQTHVQYAPNVNATAGYGPLDYGYGMTPLAVSQGNNQVNMAPFQAPNSSNNQTHRRSSIGDFLSSMVGGDSSKTSGSSSGGHRGSISKLLSPSSGKENLGRRRSSAYLSMGYVTGADGNEHKGPYANVSRSQAEHMERVRQTEKALNLTHNVDGLPLPKEDQIPRRRSSVAHFLGLDKPLLAR
ncbi:hypothetical protein BGZ94_008962 [Podila epigama]|nr:hypothetical protein BGZ94_008962 [Podila epigama]